MGSLGSEERAMSCQEDRLQIKDITVIYLEKQFSRDYETIS